MKKNEKIQKMYDNLKIKNIDSQISTIDSSNSIEVTSIDTHAGKLTRHYHFYLPKDLTRAVKSYTNPYNIPILKHHNQTNSDPIGRVVSAKYIKSENSAISPNDAKIIESLEPKGTIPEDVLKVIRRVAYNKKNDGLGYIASTGLISDYDSIEKINTGILDTVSVGYRPEKIFCSECGEDIYKCDHYPGEDYGNGPVFGIYTGMQFIEKSYVNVPADPDAGNSQYTKKHKEKDNIKDNFFTDDYSCAGECSITLTNIQTKKEDRMTYSDLVKMGDDLYNKIVEILPEGSDYDAEKIKALDDKDFVGSRLLPASSKEMVEASLKIVDQLEDGEEKQELIDFLNQRLASFSPDSINTEDDADSENLFDTDEYIKGVEETLKDHPEVKDAIVQKILAEEVDSLKSRLENYKHELKVVTDSYNALLEESKKVTEELKSMYVDKLISFRKKDDPEISVEDLKQRFLAKSLDYIKNAFEDFSLLTSDKEDDSNSIENDVENIDADTENVDNNNSITEDEIKSKEKMYFETYLDLLKVNPKKAEEFRNDYTAKIKNLKTTLKNN